MGSNPSIIYWISRNFVVKIVMFVCIEKDKKEARDSPIKHFLAQPNYSEIKHSDANVLLHKTMNKNHRLENH